MIVVERSVIRSCADSEVGGQGALTPAGKSQKYRFLAMLVRIRVKTTKLPSHPLLSGYHQPASETPFKLRFAGGPIMARF